MIVKLIELLAEVVPEAKKAWHSYKQRRAIKQVKDGINKIDLQQKEMERTFSKAIKKADEINHRGMKNERGKAD